MTVGPNCSSVWMPAISSRVPDSIGATSSSTSPSSGRAAPSSSAAAVRTAASSPRRSRTSPRSVLWAIASPHSFATTGKPSSGRRRGRLVRRRDRARPDHGHAVIGEQAQ